MATKMEIVNFLKSNYRITEENINGTLTLDFPTERGRSQRILMFVGDGLALIGSSFATTEDATPTQVFDAMDKLSTFFGVTRLGNVYTIRHVMPTSDLDPSEIEFAFGLVSAAADDLEQLITGRDLM
jgi:hypothetical protein